MRTTQQKNKELCERFGLHNGQIRANLRCKNLQWFLNNKEFGFGDLSDEDIARIQSLLGTNETFLGFNEHHGTRFQQCDHPMLEITSECVRYAKELREEHKINN